MKSQLFLSSILRGVWAMEPNAAQSYYPMLHNLLGGKVSVLEMIEKKAYSPLLVSASSRGMGTSNDMDEQYVQVLEVKDVVYKYDQECGHNGTQTLSARISSASKNPEIAAIVLDFDTPGGEGGACQLPVQVITEARSKKPVLAYVGNGMCASAGYYIASACDEIYATFNTDQIGSIGTYVTLADFKGYYSKLGLELHEIYATESTNKNKPYKDALEGKYDGIRSQLLDPFNQEFLQTVMENRNIKAASEPLTGKVYFAKDALKVGLIDGMMSFDAVINRAFELSRNPDLNKRSDRMKSKASSATTLVEKVSTKVAALVTSLTSNQQSKIEMDLGKFKSKLEASESGSVELSAEERTALIAHVEAIDNGKPLFTQADVTAQVNAAVTAAEGVKNGEIQTLNATVVTLTEEVETLKEKPAASSAIPTATDTKVVVEVKDDFSTSVDAEVKEMKNH